MGQVLGCVQVDQSEIAIDVLEPGCHFMPWCLGRHVAGYLSLRVQQLDVCCKTKTKDNVFVTVVASVQYRALNHAADAFYKLSNTVEQIQAYVFDVIMASVPKLNLDDVFEQKNDIAKAMEEDLEKVVSAYGLKIVQTLIVDIEPNEHLTRAFNEINAEAEKILQLHIKARQRQATANGLWECVHAFFVVDALLGTMSSLATWYG